MDAGPLPGIFSGIFLIFGLLAIASFAFWIWMIVDCITNEPSEGNDRILWLLVIVFLHWVGALVYYFARRPARIAAYGR